MIQDALLELADGQSSTTSVASTNVIDTLAAGDAYAGGQGTMFFVVRVDTAFTATGLQVDAAFELQSDDTTDWDGSMVTLVSSAYYTATQLPAGKIIALPIPAGAKRYLRGYKRSRNETAGTNVFSAGAWDMHLQKDAPVYRELA